MNKKMKWEEAIRCARAFCEAAEDIGISGFSIDLEREDIVCVNRIIGGEMSEWALIECLGVPKDQELVLVKWSGPPQFPMVIRVSTGKICRDGRLLVYDHGEFSGETSPVSSWKTYDGKKQSKNWKE